MEDSVDVKALRDKFNCQARTSDTSSRDINSPKSPRPGLQKTILPMMENSLTHRLTAGVLPPPSSSPGLMRFPRADPATASIPSRPVAFPRPSPGSAARASISPGDTKKVKQAGELLQNMMLRHQRVPGTNVAPARSPVSSHASSPNIPTHPLRQHSRQRSSKDVSPLRKPLPPEGPLPLKPKRPPSVNLEPFQRFRRGSAVSDSNKISANRRMSSPAVISPPQPPLRSSKPTRLPRQIASVDFEDEQDPYDDVGSFEKNENEFCNDNNSQCLEEEDEDVYESIDDDQLESNHSTSEKQNKQEAKRRLEQERKEQLEKHRKLDEIKRNFQIQGEIEVLHTAKARYDWCGEEKLDLSVRQGENVEILRVKNNPVCKWLARSVSGNYGYISNTCVDIDYEAVKRKIPQLMKMETLDLPPPPPDPPMMFNVESDSRDSLLQEDDDYDDVEEFPAPPIEISIDPKVEKEMKKKFKYEGPVRVLLTMMVDPNCVIKKFGAKDLQVTPGEIVDVIQQTSKKKYLCQSRIGKFGYVSAALLLHMEGEVYDDVDYPSDVYDNDFPQTNY